MNIVHVFPSCVQYVPYKTPVYMYIYIYIYIHTIVAFIFFFIMPTGIN